MYIYIVLFGVYSGRWLGSETFDALLVLVGVPAASRVGHRSRRIDESP
jgi:hypothetical protein